MLGRGLQRDLGVILGVLRDLEVLAGRWRRVRTGRRRDSTACAREVSSATALR